MHISDVKIERKPIPSCFPAFYFKNLPAEQMTALLESPLKKIQDQRHLLDKAEKILNEIKELDSEKDEKTIELLNKDRLKIFEDLSSSRDDRNAAVVACLCDVDGNDIVGLDRWSDLDPYLSQIEKEALRLSYTEAYDIQGKSKALAEKGSV